jgi:heme a synthase
LTNEQRVSRSYRSLIVAAACLAFGIIVLGSFVRLSDAGLGCPDWPGCYGRLAVPDEPRELEAAQARFPDQPVQQRKAWIEMVHRYFASALGLMILAIAVLAWRKREQLGQSPRLAFALVALVAVQGLLGRWTVTLLLKPAIVTAHLLGGMATLALLVLLALRQFATAPARGSAGPGLRLLALLAVAVLFAQIALGGWVSANYAALACQDFPSCNGEWLPQMDWRNAFHVLRELGKTAGGELLPLPALIAIHWVHRLGALITFFCLSLFGVWLCYTRGLRRAGAMLLAALLLQLGLGVANVWLSLPLPLAVAHNAGAALLLAILVIASFQARREI